MSPRSAVNSAVAAALAALLAACGPDAAEDAPDVPETPDEGELLVLLEYTAVVPDDWAVQEPSSSMRLAEFATDPEAGEDSPQVVVYYFGPGEGGSPQANIDRWQSQFTDSAGGPVEPEVEEVDDAAFPTTVARYEGNYARTVGMGQAGVEAEADQALHAAIVETPRGNLFIQLFGAREAVGARAEEFEGFVRSIGERQAQASAGAAAAG